MKVLIIGSGGHAKVVADILLAIPDMKPIGFASRDSASTKVLGLPILGDDRSAKDIPHDGLIIAIGDNRLRAKIHETYAGRGETFISAIHPSAIIAPDVIIEPGCMVCAGVVVNSGSRIGAHTILNTGCTVDHDCTVGPFAHVAPGVNLAGNVTVGEEAFMGIGSCAMQGLTIGDRAVVGAGAAVIRDVPSGQTVVGVPARELSSEK
ncbi:acetyltransferase [uncultured Pseudodesulfovibrio sp.]|uniref:acetyltransferase n=1 Tax=uncultured Pseudodesulfovibrio sp. TaxID=2035858 RepID=UPI0029C6C121|nr:acetyltransferase [uncultured Pseudodesulfovibrio sp.]